MSHKSLEVLEVMDVGLAADLKAAFRRNRWTAEEVKCACAGDFLGKVRQILLGQAEIKPIEHLIDCDADPFVPQGWSLTEEAEQIQNRTRGQLVWDPSKITLWLAEKQKTGWIKGHDLRQELKGKKVLNANVLDFLLKHPELIPEEWKDKAIFFWGTIYHVPYGRLSVRYLYWSGGGWHWRYHWLGYDWFVGYPAAVSASI